MLNDNAKKWIEALRSGEFKQTQGVLADNKGYCCLGVACEVYRRETGQGEWKPPTEFSTEKSFLGAEIHLPQDVQEWLNLRTSSGLMGDDRDGGHLTDLNDSKRLPFDQIADVIESEPKGLFNAA